MKIDKLRGQPVSQQVQDAAKATVAKVSAPNVDIVDIVEHFGALRDDFDVRKSELPDVAVLALIEAKAPNEVIADVAKALKMSADDLKGQVASAMSQLAAAPVVTEAQLDAAMAAPIDQRLRPEASGAKTTDAFGRLKDMPAAEMQQLLLALSSEMAKEGEKGVTEPVVQTFVRRYEELTGVRFGRAPDVQKLLAHHGDILRELLLREVPLAFIASTEPTKQAQVRQLTSAIYDRLGEKGVANEVAHVGRGIAKGAQGAAYDAAAKVREVERITIAPASAVVEPQAPVHKGLLFADNAGDEAWLTREMAKRGVAIVMGGDAQARADAEELLARDPHRVILCGGFADEDKAWMESMKKKAAVYLPDAATKPIEAGRAIGAFVADLVTKEKRDRLNDPFLKVAIQASSGQMKDAAQHLQQTAAANRVVRILNAVANRLEREGVPRANIFDDVNTLSQKLAQYTFGVDNFKDNALWQSRAKAAFAEAAAMKPDIAKVVDASMVDVYFASWSGIQRKPDQPSFFENNTYPLVNEAQTYDWSQPSTMLDLNKYRYIRLDDPIANTFKDACKVGGECKPEVFLGSEEEMTRFYEAKGFAVAFQTGDSNGTKYLLLTKGDVQKPVVVGVDSPARLTQVCALMEQAGVPTKDFVLRGDMDRVRAKARNGLEIALKAIGMPIAGVVINNKNDSIDALAKMAGVDGKAVRTGETRSVGPFTFDVIEVRGVGDEKPRALLAFKPAYGELTEDLTSAALTLGARNFAICGAAGSLVQDDVLGALHRVTKVAYGKEQFDLTKIEGLELMKSEKVDRDGVTNVFHPSPPLQGQAWAQETRDAHGAANVDQESGAAMATLAMSKMKPIADATEPPKHAYVEGDIFVSTIIHNSDVVGKGFLELGTVDDKYTPHILEIARQFFAEMGIGSVKTVDGGWAPIKGAKAGKLAVERNAIDVSKVDVPIPDMGSISFSNEYSHVDQLKGEKRVVMVETKNASVADRQAFAEALARLPRDAFWIAVPANDPLHGDMVKLAKDRGFETVILATKEEIEGDRVLGSPTFVMRFDDDEKRAAAKDEMTTKGTKYPWEENEAQHWSWKLGEFERTETPPAHHIYTRDLGRGDGAKMGDLMRTEVDDKRRQIEDSLADWAAGSTTARAGDTLAALVARFDGGLKAEAIRALNPSLAAGDDAPIPAGTKVVLREGPARPPPATFDPAFAHELLGDRKPLLFSGASAKSWPNLSVEDRALAVKQVQLLARLLDPKKVMVWTGGTDFGYEKFVHDAFGKRGFEILGTGTENILKDVTKLSPHLTHYMTAGINWFGKSRPVLNLLEDLGGEYVGFAGGAILKSEIMLAVALGVRSHVATGLHLSPQGEAALAKAQQKAAEKGGEPDAIIASQELADTLKAHTFDSVRSFLERLGVPVAGLTKDDLSNDITPELLKAVQDVSDEAASMARTMANAEARQKARGKA